MARALVPARVMESLTHDVRFAIRTLTRNPLYAGTVVLTLALAAGGNTAIFSLINASLWRPLAGVQEPERLARLTRPSFSYPLFEALTAEGLFDVVAFHDERLPVEHNGAIHWSRVLTASGSYYPTLGIAARLGRTFGPEEDRAAAPVAVLSHAFWTRACGGDRGIVGATIRIDGVPLTIVGVTPPEFTGVVTGVRPDITVPLRARARITPVIRS